MTTTQHKIEALRTWLDTVETCIEALDEFYERTHGDEDELLDVLTIPPSVMRWSEEQTIVAGLEGYRLPDAGLEGYRLPDADDDPNTERWFDPATADRTPREPEQIVETGTQRAPAADLACPSCERTFGSKQALAVHRTRSHGPSAAREEKAQTVADLEREVFGDDD